MTAQNKLAKNLIFSVFAQGLSLLVSFIVGFIVPKFIPELQYSYWQVFLLYYGYVGLFHFGLVDGLVLRYAQYDYDQLDKTRMRSQFVFLMGMTSLIAVVGVLLSGLILGGEMLLVGVLVSVGIVVKNYFAYTSYTFQMTNRIKYYAWLVILQRALYGVIILLLLILKVDDFYWYCIADIFSELLSTVVASFLNKGMYLGKTLSIKETFKEAGANIYAGAFLTVANLSSMLIVGGAKMIIQWRWDELVFGKLAFSFSVANLFLAFITAISVVLFPSLKRMKEEEYPDMYGKISGMIMPVLFLVLMVYFPGCWVLKKWLPNYAESLVYLGILLPFIVFSSKKSLLTNNYLKVYRKEKLMLLINLFSVAVGVALFAVFAYSLNNLEGILYCLIGTIMFSSIASEIVVMKLIKRLKIWPFIVEFLMTVIFILAARFLSLWIGFAVYTVAVVLYLILYRKQIGIMIKKKKS